MASEAERVSPFSDAYRKLNDGFQSLARDATVGLTGDECAAVVDRLYSLEESLRNLVDAAKTRSILPHAKPEGKLEGALWTEKISAFVDAVESAEEVLGG